jgi:hypothetical protein
MQTPICQTAPAAGGMCSVLHVCSACARTGLSPCRRRGAARRKVRAIKVCSCGDAMQCNRTEQPPLPAWCLPYHPASACMPVSYYSLLPAVAASLHPHYCIANCWQLLVTDNGCRCFGRAWACPGVQGMFQVGTGHLAMPVHRPTTPLLQVPRSCDRVRFDDEMERRCTSAVGAAGTAVN